MALRAGTVPRTADFLVIGGGIIGVNVALVLRKRFPEASVAVLEKETFAGEHASGRNSGVLHAGFYYTDDSLKAKFTRQGNAWTREYCKSRGLRLNECGKVVVAQRKELVDGIHTLHQRGIRNKVDIELVTAAEAKELEPLARTHEVALWSPTTASADPGEVMSSLVDDAVETGVDVCCGAGYVASEAGPAGRTQRVTTAAGDIEAGHVVNCAGLYADRVARDFGVGQHYHIMPFKGLYLYLERDRVPLRRHVYPTPDLANPFLGVHFTVTVDGEPKIGPTAIPALWREQYTFMDNFAPREMGEIMLDQMRLIATNAFNFRSLARKEISKYYLPVMLNDASALVADPLDRSSVRQYGRPGIRAQLLDTRTSSLVMDFLVENGPASTHVLNAVSPGWTCARPFAEHIVSEHVQAQVQK